MSLQISPGISKEDSDIDELTIKIAFPSLGKLHRIAYISGPNARRGGQRAGSI